MPVSSDPIDEIRRRLDEKLPRAADPLARRLAEGHDGCVAAVVFYGSHLYAGAAAPDSERDYFVIVDSLSAYHASAAHALANRVLPPSVYHAPSGDGRRCKVSVLSRHQLARETSPRARDLHHLGRFSKPLGLAYARDEDAWRAIREAQLGALVTLTPLARGGCGSRFTVEQLMLALFGLSYLGEQRVAEPAKVRAIFESDRPHHLALGALLLEAEGAATPLSDGEFSQREPAAERMRATALIRRSRRRSLARWPKYLYTFDGWLDYAVAKVERHSGAPLALAPRARKHPLLFGWPALLALRRRGVVK